MKMKKYLAIILAAVMLLGCMSFTAMAAEFDCETCDGTGKNSDGSAFLNTLRNTINAAKTTNIATFSAQYANNPEIAVNNLSAMFGLHGDTVKSNFQYYMSDVDLEAYPEVNEKTEILEEKFRDVTGFLSAKMAQFGVSASSESFYEEIISALEEEYFTDIEEAYTSLADEVEKIPCPDCEGTGKVPEFAIKNGVLTAYNGEGGDIVIPSGVTAIGEDVFDSIKSITGVVIPSGVTSIGDYAFAKCTNLTSVTIPDSVTEIGEMAFYDCDKLPGVTIPAGVTTIGEDAFRSCDVLTDVTLCWTNADDIPEAPSGVFTVWQATLHIPRGMTDAYAAKGWCDYFSEEDENSIIDDVVISLTTFTLSKDYDDAYTADTKSAKVSETVSFTIAPIAGAPGFASNGAVSVTVTSGEGSVDVDLPAFTAAGDFWYTITETAGTTAGVTYNTAPCYLHVVVHKIGGEYKAVSTAIHTTAPDEDGEYLDDDKITSVSNSYGEGTLKITQDTTVDGADNDYDAFEVTVTFTLPEGTDIAGEITYGDKTIVPEDWTNGSVTVTVDLKGGEYVEFIGIPDGTTYTVEQTDSNTDLGFGDPDYTVENGETDDVVVTESDKETKVTGTISDGEDDITIANEMITPVDVGVILESGAFIILALGAIAFGVWLIVSKRRKSLDAE